jgi:2-oxoglutarate ferredoxin oxidoreductase subunit beta
MTCMMLNNEVYGMTGGQASPTTSASRYTTTSQSGSIEPVFDACAVAAAAGAGFVGRELTIQTPALKNILRDAIAHKGFSFVEVISDCTEIFGRKNDLGESPEMIMTQKAAMRPATYGVVGGNIVDEPFPPINLRTGVIAQADRPEYGETYRNHAAAIRAALKE